MSRRDRASEPVDAATHPPPSAPVDRLVADRYAALLGLVGALASASRTSLHSVLREHVGRGLPDTHLSLALSHHPGGALSVQSDAGEPLALTPTEVASLRTGEALNVRSGPDRSAVIAVALPDGSHGPGWLAAEGFGGADFGPDDAAFLVAVGRLATFVLGSSTDGSRLRERGTDEAERLDSLARDLAGSLDLAAVVDRIATKANEIADRPVVLWLVDGERSRAVARAGGALVRLGEEQLLTPQILEPLRRSAEGGDPTAVEADQLTVALALGSRIVGFLVLGPWEGEPPSQEQATLLRRLAPHAASAVENARLHAEVRRLSLTDPLVQLPNRRQLDLYLEKEFAAAVRGRELAMVMYDLDRFKEYNDAHGHQAGDRALVGVAEILRSETRAMNLAVRYGGEEFAAVLSGTTLEGAQIHAERVRRRVHELFGPELSVSAGVAAWRPGMESPVDLILAADRALYRAKIEGRNRVHVAEG